MTDSTSFTTDLRNRILESESSVSNPLLNHRFGKDSIRVVDELPDIILGKLRSGERMRFLPVPGGPSKKQIPDPERILQNATHLVPQRRCVVEISECVPRVNDITQTALQGFLDLPAEVDVPRRPRGVTLDYWIGLLKNAADNDIRPTWDLPVVTQAAATAEKHGDNDLQTLATGKQLDRTLETLWKQVKSTREERGVNPLYAAVGFLNWCDPKSPEKRLSAPLILIPLTIRRQLKDGTHSYAIEAGDGRISENTALRERLLSEFGFELPKLDADENAESYLSRVAEALNNMDRGWRVRRYATIAVFDFARIAIYEDLDPAGWMDMEGAEGEEVATSLFQASTYDPVAAPAYDGDAQEILKEIPHLVANADSSQLSVVVDALRGNNLAVEGPPGTGKSQTIANLIAAAMSRGESVLFVAEKSAALNVVESRMTGYHLGEFVLNMHRQTNYAEIYKALRDRLAIQGREEHPSDLDSMRADLQEKRSQLSSYISALNEPFGALGWPAQRILWREQSLRESITAPPEVLNATDLTDIENLDASAFSETYERVADFARHVGSIQERYGRIDQHPWFGIEKPVTDPVAFRQLRERIDSVGMHLASLTKNAAIVFDVLSKPTVPHFRCALEGMRSLADVTNVCDAARALNVGSVDADQLAHAVDLLTERETQTYEPTLGTADTRSDVADRVSSVLEHIQDLDGGYTLSDVRSIADKASKKTSHFKAASDGRTRLLSTFNIRDDVTETATLRGLVSVLTTIVKADPVALELCDPSFVSGRDAHAIKALKSARTTLSKARKATAGLKSRDLRDVETRLKIPWSQPDLADQIAADAENLQRDDFFAGLIPDVRKARKRAKKYLKVRGRAWADLGSDMSKAAAYLRAWATVNDKVVRQHLPDGFDPLHGNYDALIEAYGLLERLVERTAKLPDDVANALWQHLMACDMNTLAKTAQQAGENRGVRTLSSVLQKTRARDVEAARKAAERQAAARHEATTTLIDTCGLDDHFTVAFIREIPDIVARQQRVSADIGETFGYTGITAEMETLLGAVKTLCDAGLSIVEAQALLSADPDGLMVIAERTDDTLRDLDGLERMIRELEESDEVNVGKLLGVSVDAPDLYAIKTNIDTLNDAREEISSWSDYRGAEQKLHDRGLRWFVASYTESKTDYPVADMAAAYELAVMRAMVGRIMDARPILRSVNGSEGEHLKTRFRQIDTVLLDLDRRDLRARLTQAEIPEGESDGPKSQWTDRRLVENEVKKKQKFVAPRDLMDRAGAAVRALTPCFMMSPLAVGEYLPQRPDQFDLVVIDEASQIRPEDAIGAIKRGRRAVVVGDRRQLPPTTFFNRSVEADESDDAEADQLEDVDSILDLATRAWQPFRRLQWHYRSRHENLIAFSNHEFYDEDLVIFPTSVPDRPGYGLAYRKVDDGTFKRGQNEREAQVVVNSAIEALKESPDRSLGIAALNQKQANLLENMFDRALTQDPEARRVFEAWETSNEGIESVFIKNLENVQGDERDRIFISMTYGPDPKTGRVRNHFGPINSENGHRRLNVLFTRAREEMRVFTSMEPEDVDAPQSASWGRLALRNFLEFAKTGELYTGKTRSGEPDNDFERVIRDRLRRLGYNVDCQVGVSGFYIDLAVEHPKSGGYLVGIESDGATYHSDRVTRDRDRLRQEVLESLGWTIYRIWSTDWFADPDGETQKLDRFLRSLTQSEDQHAPMRSE